ncbi:MAG: hypothetical protein ABW000_19240 [Actinoplanes sp.]
MSDAPRPDAALHELLLRLAGNAADELIASARDQLAEGRPGNAARLVATSAESGWFHPTDADLRLLTAVEPTLDAATIRASAGRSGTATSDGDWEFAPVIPVPGEPALIATDLTTGGETPVHVDAIAAGAAERQEGAVALWRAWRAPDELNPQIGRIYLLETTAAADQLPRIAAELQTALRAAGIEEPQVEVFRPDTELPWYQRKARGRSALLWAVAPAGPVTIARDFDSVDPQLGPQFHANHERLTDDEAARVLAYLDGGEALLATTARENDILESSLGEVVPQSFRTDGTWIWTDAVSYYLRAYGLAPDQELLAHIRGRDYRIAALDDVSRHRAMVELFRPVDQPS